MFRLRWLIGPYSPSGSPFRLDGDVIVVRFQWLEVARDFCDGLIPVCLLSVMALSLHSCYPHWVMPIQLLPPVAVVIHNGLMAYVVATSARIVICTEFWPRFRQASYSPFLRCSIAVSSLCSYRMGASDPLSGDSSCLPEVCVGAPFRPLMGLGALPPFEECTLIDVDRSLGFCRDFSTVALVALFRFDVICRRLLVTRSLIESERRSLSGRIYRRG